MPVKDDNDMDAKRADAEHSDSAESPSASNDKADAKAKELLEKAEAREKAKDAKARERRRNGKNDKGAVAYVKRTASEMKASYKPGPSELVRWCLIVIVTIVLFAVFCTLVDNFIATPLMYYIGEHQIGDGQFGPYNIALTVAFFLTGLASAVGVMLHQGGDAEGLSDTLADKMTGGSSTAQRNLDRITVVCIALFVITVVLMMVSFPQSTLMTAGM